MAWEYRAKIRPAIQPFIAFASIETLNFFSVTNPYHQAFFLRFITAILALFAISFFIDSCKSLIRPNLFKGFMILSYFLWFLPWINVRFSSESWSGSFFLMALALALRQNFKGKYLLMGLVLGLSFLFRFQSAFLTLGLLAWLLFIQKENLTNIIKIALTGLLVLVAGFLIDSWFYGEWTVTFWNYAYINIWEDVASRFGTHPWYYYIYWVFRFSFFPFGIIIILSFLILLYKDSKNIFIWSILPFLIIHIIIPHKELRFLFPLVNILPIILVLSLQKITSPAFRFPKWSYMVFVPLIVINFIALTIMSLKPAGKARIQLAQSIEEIYGNKPITLYHFWHCNPYNAWGLPAKFYKQKNIKTSKIKVSQQINDIKNKPKGISLLILKKKYLQKPNIKKVLKLRHFKSISQSIPEWMIPFLKIYGGYDTGEIFVLYEKE